jgi:hypothetical protein
VGTAVDVVDVGTVVVAVLVVAVVVVLEVALVAVLAGSLELDEELDEDVVPPACLLPPHAATRAARPPIAPTWRRSCRRLSSTVICLY